MLQRLKSFSPNVLKYKYCYFPNCYVCRYDKKSEAELAITQMNGVIPEGGHDPLVVKVAEEHGKMKAAYYAGYHAGLQNNRGSFRGTYFTPRVIVCHP
jgi:protein sex-lethal